MQYIKLFLVLMIVISSGFMNEIFGQSNVNGKSQSQGIERKVFKQLIKLPHYGVFDHIVFQIDGDTVILSGKVAEARNKKDAENAVEDISGVARVVNNIEILPLSPFDNAIRVRLVRAFIRHGGGVFRYLQEPNPSVRLIVERGHVTLEGYVANRGDYNLMNILANGVTDVFSVENNLLIEKEQNR
jgi:hyperosmotically inducible periplasmic protein